MEQSEASKRFLGELPVDENEPTSFEPPDESQAKPEEDTPESTKTEEVDTETETSKEDTETETTKPVDINKVFEEQGLGAYYKSPEEALRRIREHTKYITKLEQEKSELLKAKPQETPKKPEPLEIDGDSLFENPVEELSKLGYVKKEDVVRLAENVVNQQFAAKEAEKAAERYNDFIANTPDFNKVEPYIDRLLQENPALGALPPDKGIELLYKLGKMEMVGNKTPTKTVVEKADEDKKQRASTSGGKSSVKASSQKTLGGLTIEQQNKMSLEEIERKVGFGD